MGPLGSGPRCGTDGLGQYKTPDMRDSVRDDLWRPGGAFCRLTRALCSHQSIPIRHAPSSDYSTPTKPTSERGTTTWKKPSKYTIDSALLLSALFIVIVPPAAAPSHARARERARLAGSDSVKSRNKSQPPQAQLFSATNQTKGFEDYLLSDEIYATR